MINSISSELPSKYYVYTACDKNCNGAEIEIDGKDYRKLQNNELRGMFGYKFIETSNSRHEFPIEPRIMADYMKALNGIFPKGVSYDCLVPLSGSQESKNTEYKARGKKDGSLIVVDKVKYDQNKNETDRREVLCISPVRLI